MATLNSRSWRELWEVFRAQAKPGRDIFDTWYAVVFDFPRPNLNAFPQERHAQPDDNGEAVSGTFMLSRLK